MLGVVAAWSVLLALPAIASACTASENADLRAGMQLVAGLRGSGAAGAGDAAAILQRARRSCSDARFARAVASATTRFGSPAPGRRVRVAGMDLIASAGGAWRLDVLRIAQRLAAARSDRAAAVLRAQLRSAGFGQASISWSADATQLAWDADLQSAVAAQLARSHRPLEHALAGASVRAFAPTSRQAPLGSLDLLGNLRIANRLALAAAVSGHPGARSASRAVAVRVFVRVRAAHQAGWSKVGGSWSTLPTHRALVTQSSALLARVPHARTATIVRELRAALTSPTDVTFETLPAAAFYPWPRDAAYDSQSVAVTVDKPGTLTLTVYGGDGAVVRTIRADVVPGPATITWDGTAADGSTLGPGEYRYNLDAVDLAGNRVRVPGLDEFEIARDTTPPTVRSVAARHVIAGGTRRVIASWDVSEEISPQVHTWLLLQNGDHRETLDLHPTLQKATVRRLVTLARGTWRATFVFSDGSGNRTSSAAGSFVVS
jgi:hypothetical protein